GCWALKTGCGSLSASLDCLRAPHNRGHTAFDIFIGSGPTGNGDTHGGVSVPLGTAAPAGTFRLNLGDDPASFLRAAEGYEHLIQHNVVQYGEARSAEAVGEDLGLAAVALNHFSQAAAPQ